MSITTLLLLVMSDCIFQCFPVPTSGNYQISMVWFHQQDALHQSRRQGGLGCNRQCVSKKESGLTSFNFWLLEFKDNHSGWKRSQEGHKNGKAILQEQNKQAVLYDEIGTNTNGFKKAIIKFRQVFKTFPTTWRVKFFLLFKDGKTTTKIPTALKSNINELVKRLYASRGGCLL